MHYEIGERDNGIIDGEKVENAFFGCKLFTATAILRSEYSTASLSALSRNSAAIIRPRCEKSIDGASSGIARHYRLKLYATPLIKYRGVIYSWNGTAEFISMYRRLRRRSSRKAQSISYYSLCFHNDSPPFVFFSPLCKGYFILLNPSHLLFKFFMNFPLFYLQYNSGTKLQTGQIFDRSITNKHMIHSQVCAASSLLIAYKSRVKIIMITIWLHTQLRTIDINKYGTIDKEIITFL